MHLWRVRFRSMVILLWSNFFFSFDIWLIFSVHCARSPEAWTQNSDFLKHDSWKLHVAMLSICMLKRGKGSDEVYQAFFLWCSLLFLVLRRLLRHAGCFLIILGENCVQWMVSFHKRGERWVSYLIRDVLCLLAP